MRSPRTHIILILGLLFALTRSAYAAPLQRLIGITNTGRLVQIDPTNGSVIGTVRSAIAGYTNFEDFAYFGGEYYAVTLNGDLIQFILDGPNNYVGNTGKTTKGLATHGGGSLYASISNDSDTNCESIALVSKTNASLSNIVRTTPDPLHPEGLMITNMVGLDFDASNYLWATNYSPQYNDGRYFKVNISTGELTPWDPSNVYGPPGWGLPQGVYNGMGINRSTNAMVAIHIVGPTYTFNNLYQLTPCSPTPYPCDSPSSFVAQLPDLGGETIRGLKFVPRVNRSLEAVLQYELQE